MSDSETKVIVGQCVAVEQKPGSDWVKFEINHGGKWTTKLDTKVSEIIEQAKAVGSDVATWTFKEQESDKINERSGKPFVNRYLSKVEAGDHSANGGATASGTPLPEAHYDTLAPADKDRAITRMSCLSSAATLLQGVEFENELQRVTAWIGAASAAETHVYKQISEPDYDPEIPF